MTSQGPRTISPTATPRKTPAEIRAEAGLTQAELAALAHCHRQTIGQIERRTYGYFSESLQFRILSGLNQGRRARGLPPLRAGDVDFNRYFGLPVTSSSRVDREEARTLRRRDRVRLGLVRSAGSPEAGATRP